MANQKNSPIKYFELQPRENSDWGYARNAHSVLMVPSAEWVQSMYSCQFEMDGKAWMVPNRDSPYEGLLAHHDGENWKFIDCIGIALQDSNGKYIPLVPSNIKVNSFKIIYIYKCPEISCEDNRQDGIEFFVSYYLNSESSPDLITGEIEIGFVNREDSDDFAINLLIRPFLDIRHMYSESNFDNYQILKNELNSEWQQVSILNFNRRLSFYLPAGEVNVFDRAKILNWYCKLGEGSRCESFSDSQIETAFIGAQTKAIALFDFKVIQGIKQKPIKLFFSCGLSEISEQPFLLAPERVSELSHQQNERKWQQIQQLFPIPEQLEFRDAIWARVVGLTKFKTYMRHPESGQAVQVPHAGSGWFKTPWYRDVFEGILNSFETLITIPEERENIKNIILLALHYQDVKTGLILNRVPEYKLHQIPYNGLDATLLCLIAANQYTHKTKDVDFALEFLSHARQAILCLQASDNQVFQDYSFPSLDEETGLLLSPPHYSWTDVRVQSVEYAGWKMEKLPNRASKSFVKDLYDMIANKEGVEIALSSSRFFLPEINAQWIVVLKGVLETIDFISQNFERYRVNLEDIEEQRKSVETILVKAKDNFKLVFWNQDIGFLFNLVDQTRTIKDEMEAEAAITAAGMLGEEVFTQQELTSIWNWAKKKLLVSRRLVKYGQEVLPFGIITTNSDQRIFYGDNEYHGDVVWLRSTPYLLKLLKLLNQEEIIRDILLNTLDHQMTESAILYNQELLSKPLGNNSCPDAVTQKNPVPVKNPIQFWSQWCDAFIEFFGEK